MKRYLIVTIVIVAAVMGCDETIYKIEMAPKGNKLSRTLTVWCAGESRDTGQRMVKRMDDAELGAVAKAYSKDKPKNEPRKYKFTGTFADAMPNDVGGAGRFIRHESRMGVASSYIERFRGHDRPGEVIEASLKAVDEITDILIGYLESKLGKEKEFPKLRKFMDAKLRKDLKNLSVYSYMAFNDSRLNWLDVEKDDIDTQGQEIIARAVAYIIERGYVEPKDLSLLRRSFNLSDAAKTMLVKVLNRLVTKVGITDKKFIARLASLLTDEKNLETSFEAYLKTTPQYKLAVKTQKITHSGVPEKDKETSGLQLVVTPLMKKAAHFRLEFGNTSRLDMQLTLPIKPANTNGKWNAKDRTVTWKGALTARDEQTTFLPEICYALWSEPNEKFQKAKFGKVILIGQELMNYCIWRQGLAPDEAKFWDAVLVKHKPGQDLAAAVKAAADPDKPMPYIEEGMKLLQDALKK